MRLPTLPPVRWSLVPTLNDAQTNAMQHLLRIAPVIDELGELFRGAGHQLYLVGGSVRDALLGNLGTDLTSPPPLPTRPMPS